MGSSPAKQGLKREVKQLEKPVGPKRKPVGPEPKPMLDENKNRIPDTVESIESKQGNIKKPTTRKQESTKPKNSKGDKRIPKPIPPKPNIIEQEKKDDVPEDKKTEKKSKVTKGDVVQTIAAPHLNLLKTVKVVKRYTPPKVKKKVKNVIKKGKDVIKKGKDWWESPA